MEAQRIAMLQQEEFQRNMEDLQQWQAAQKLKDEQHRRQAGPAPPSNGHHAGLAPIRSVGASKALQAVVCCGPDQPVRTQLSAERCRRSEPRQGLISLRLSSLQSLSEAASKGRP